MAHHEPMFNRPLGQLTKAVDQAGNEWLTTYDLAGRVTERKDPDSGTRKVTYTLANEVETSTDGRNITLAYTYDNLGRKTAVFDGSESGFKRAGWTYDTIAKGQLTSSVRYVGPDAFTNTVTGYDDGYRPLGTTSDIPSSTTQPGLPAGSFTSSMTYNVDGSIKTQTYPNAGGMAEEVVTTTYDNAGLVLTQASPAATYVSGTSYYWFGSVYQQLLGSGTKRVRRTTTVDQATGRTTGDVTDTQNQTVTTNWDMRLSEQYGYDPAGNVKSINEINTAGTPVANQ